MTSDTIDQLPFFAGLSSEQSSMLKQLFLPVDCYSDSMLFDQGDPAEYLYLVVTGEVVIRFKPEDGALIPIAHVRSGGIVGWSAALGRGCYTSAAFCEGYTQMLRLAGRELRDVCERDPETGILVLERLAAVIAERLSNTHEQVMALLKQSLLPSMNDMEEATHGRSSV